MSTNNIQPDANSLTTAQSRIDQFIQPSEKILSSLETQYSSLSEKVKTIYQKAQEELTGFKATLKDQLPKSSHLSKKEIKYLAKNLKKTQSQIAKLVLRTQQEVRLEIAKTSSPTHSAKIDFLSKEHPIYKIAQRILTTFSKEWRKAAQALKQPEKEMLHASHDLSGISPNGKLEEERVHDYFHFSTKRKGVLIVGDQVRVRPEFSIRKVEQQLKSFQALIRSEQPRKVLSVNLSGILKDEIKEELIPLNTHFDKRVGVDFFKGIYGEGTSGERAIGSLNRQEKHLVNGYLSTLGTTFKAFRHGIISSVLGKGSNRQEESQKIAEELLTAVLLESLKSQNMSLEDAKDSSVPIQLHLTSVSAVTPDYFRSISFLGQKSERTMLQDQVQALKAAETLKSITVNGHVIPIRAKVRTFNFGVNDGAIGKLKFAPGLKLGLDTQFKLNEDSWLSLSPKQDAQGLLNDARRLLNGIDIEIIKDNKNEENRPKTPKEIRYEAINHLIIDLENLLFTKESYLNGMSQYEAGAKIINLCNLMTEYSQLYKKTVVEELGKKLPRYEFLAMNALESDDRNAYKQRAEEIKDVLEKIGQLPLEYTAAFNCYSGKDRTGVLDCIAKAFHLMYLKNGRVPTTNELKNNKDVKKEFADIVTKLLLESGNLEITEINGARGFKITESSAKFAGLPLGDFLLKYTGLGKTTSS